MRIRQATPGDFPEIGDVILEALSADPQWMPFLPVGARDDPESIEFIDAILKPCHNPASQDFMVMVAEVPSDESLEIDSSIFAAVTVWDLSSTTQNQGSSTLVPKLCLSTHSIANCNEIQDLENAVGNLANGDTSKLASLVKATDRSRLKDLKKCHDECMHLRVVATLPRYQKRGYAKALCEWGIGFAGSRGIGVTVSTSPLGYILFSDLGFVDVGPLSVPIGGGEEDLVLKAMYLAPRRKQGLLSFLGSLLG